MHLGFAGRGPLSLCLLSVLTLLSLPSAASQHETSCAPANILVVHPAHADAYEVVFRDIAEGIRSASRRSVSVCSVDDIALGKDGFSPKKVFALGEDVYTKSVSNFSSKIVIPVLVRKLPKGAKYGVSLHISPRPILRTLCNLYATGKERKSVTLIHRAEVDKKFLELAKQEASQCSISLTTKVADNLLTIGSISKDLLTNPPSGSVVWFHDDVIRINPNLLLPKIARLSWKAVTPVIADQADYVKRGLLFAHFHDYRGLGRLCASLLTKEPIGMVFSSATKSALNMRTAKAIGLPVRQSKQADFDAIYD